MRTRFPTLLGLVLLAACDLGPQPPFGTEAATEPELFAPGRVSSQGYDEYGPTFSRDGREVYFTRSTGGRRGRPSILVSRVEGGAWGEAEPASFSTGWEEAPFLTPDGRRLLYSSRRDIPGWGPARDNANLWMVERTDEGGWSEPVPVSGDVNRPRVGGRGGPDRSETGPALLADGTLLYSTEEEPERSSDIYAADPASGGRWVNARPMLLNTAGDEAHPTVSPDGRYLVFDGFRDVFAPGQDLFVSERTEYGWSEPVPLPEPVNSPADEVHPRFSPDGGLLFFSSDRGASRLSIYYVRVEAAGMEPPTPGRRFVPARGPGPERTVPEEAPDSIPAWTWADSLFVTDASGDPVSTAVLRVQFELAATRADKQAALDLARGVVVGGVRGGPEESYYVWLGGDGTLRTIDSVAAALQALPQVRAASPQTPLRAAPGGPR